jgi:hydroxymethylglutaryl-CoA synthase
MIRYPGIGTVESVTKISNGGAPPEFSNCQQRVGDYAALIVATDLEKTMEITVSILDIGTGAAPEVFAIGDRVVCNYPPCLHSRMSRQSLFYFQA